MRILRFDSRLLALIGALIASAVPLAAPAPASADRGEAIIERCLQGKSLAGFSQSEYHQALKDLSAGAEEYSDCSSLINQAQIAAAGSRSDGSGGSGPAGGGASSTADVATPAEQSSVARAAHGASEPVRLGNQAIQPGVVHTDISSALSSLPTPLLVTLVFMLACVLLLAGVVWRIRLRPRRPS